MAVCEGYSSGLPYTGSFQNQTTSEIAHAPRKAIRKRGMTAVLHDSTNTLEGIGGMGKRACKERAVEKLAALPKGAPRGNSKAGGQARSKSRRRPSLTVSDVCTESPSTQQYSSLEHIHKHSKPFFQTGMECIEKYIQRNAPFEMQKAIAINVMTTAMSCWDLGIVDSAQMAAEVTGYAAKTVRNWASMYFTSLASLAVAPDDITDDIIENELSSDRGKSTPNPHSLIYDEAFQMQAREYVRSHACRKGEPNLTVSMFRQWVLDTFHQSVCDEKARSWLHHLGFTQRQHSKGVYFDGHEREDVVAYRQHFLDKLLELDTKSLTVEGNTPELSSGEKPLIRVCHDESTFYSNADQSQLWSDGETAILRQKSLGASIMVSDFVDEQSGYLKHHGKEARLYLETQRDGYFTNEGFVAQVDKAIDIFEEKYPHATALFLFENAPSHKKYDDDVLNVAKMNVSPGGKQPVMRDTVWNGVPQKMVLPDGRPKGLRLVLEERDIDTSGMHADKLRKTLSKFHDFAEQKTIVEERVESRGHLCMFIPKFHCELNPIERCWCHAKQHTRRYVNGSITRLRQILPQALDNCTPEMIQKFFRTCRDYEKSYRDGHSGKDVDKAVKVYKSHRRVSTVN